MFTIVIPALNEYDNLQRLIPELQKCTKASNMIIVDDGSDHVFSLCNRFNITYLRGRHKGLTAAVLDGIKAAPTECVVVMDADMQHSPLDVDNLANSLNTYDIVVGSRYTHNGRSYWESPKRKLMSRAACLIGNTLTGVKDNTTGFFALHKYVINPSIDESAPRTLIEILVKGTYNNLIEVPIIFRIRFTGQSKLYSQKAFSGYASFLRHILQLHQHALVNKFWITRNPKDADYDWFAWYNGTLPQKWWKKTTTQKIATLAHSDTSKTVLELGCGSNPTLFNIPYKNALGVDINCSKVRFMNTHTNGHPVRFIHADITTLRMSCQYDIIICSEVLEHIAQPHDVLKTVVEHLKPGGVAILTTPDFTKPLWNIVERFTPYQEEHITHLSLPKLVEMCKTHNLSYAAHTYVADADLVAKFTKGG